MKHKVYLAGAITGLTYGEGQNWRAYAKEWLSQHNILGYSPLRAKEYLKENGVLEGSYEDHPLSSQKGLFNRDLYDCRSCDLLFVNLLGVDRVSIGTVFEMGACFSLNKPIILVMEKGGIHTHPFILESSAYVVETLQEGLDIANTILNA